MSMLLIQLLNLISIQPGQPILLLEGVSMYGLRISLTITGNGGMELQWYTQEYQDFLASHKILKVKISAMDSIALTRPKGPTSE